MQKNASSLSAEAEVLISGQIPKVTGAAANPGAVEEESKYDNGPVEPNQVSSLAGATSSSDVVPISSYEMVSHLM